MRNGRPSDKDLYDRLALAVEAVREAGVEYQRARSAYCERRLEHLRAGREPEDFGVVLSGLDASSQLRSEQVARDNRAIDEQTARKVPTFRLKT